MPEDHESRRGAAPEITIRFHPGLTGSSDGGAAARRPETRAGGIAVRHGWAPGVVGGVVQAHAAFYAREWSFGSFFEAKVARRMGAFLLRHDPARDRLFRTEEKGEGGRFLGSLTVDGGDPDLSERGGRAPALVHRRGRRAGVAWAAR